MDYVEQMGIGRLITNNTRRSLETDWRFAQLNDRLLADIGAGDIAGPDVARLVKIARPSAFGEMFKTIVSGLSSARGPARV